MTESNVLHNVLNIFYLLPSPNIYPYHPISTSAAIVVLASGLEPAQIQSKPVGMSVLKPSQKWFEER